MMPRTADLHARDLANYRNLDGDRPDQWPRIRFPDFARTRVMPPLAPQFPVRAASSLSHIALPPAFELQHPADHARHPLPTARLIGQLLPPGLGLTTAKGPEYGIFTVLEQWVESGAAPHEVIATKYIGDDSKRGVQMTRKLCPYPQVAVYNGSGDTNDYSNFACVAQSPAH